MEKEKRYLLKNEKENKIKLYFDKKYGIANLNDYFPLVYIPEKIVILDKIEVELFAAQGKISNTGKLE